MDKTTFIIVMLKLLAIQIILAGMVIAVVKDAGYYTIFLTLGSLIFAVASNCMLAHVLHTRPKSKGESSNGR